MESLAALLRMAHEAVNDIRDTRLLIVLDDFDLIHRDEVGHYDPEPLLKTLASLCETRNLHGQPPNRRRTHDHRQGRAN